MNPGFPTLDKGKETPAQNLKMITVDPLQLNFKRPLVDGTKDYFTIFNNSQSPLAFKIKTTAPRHYFVKPNHGRIEPGASSVILVSMHSVNEELGEAAALNSPIKCRDKFLVQVISIGGATAASIEGQNVVALAANGEADVSRWWSNLTEAQKEGMQEFKLKCNYVDGDDEDQLKSSGTGIRNSSTFSLEASSSSMKATSPASMAQEPSQAFHSYSKKTLVVEDGGSDSAAAMRQQQQAGKEAISASQQLLQLQHELAIVKTSLKEKEKELASRIIQGRSSAGYSISPVMVVLLVILAFLVGLLF